MARLAVVAGSIVAALLVWELILRAVGFEYHTFPTAQFGWPEPEAIAKQFEPERDLFWVPKNYGTLLEDARKFRPMVTFLGDSCTQFGTYPRLTLDRFEELGHRDLARGVKLAVAGWSTEQGLGQVRRDIVPLAPRFVTIYFGWNDHWVALGPPDDEARPSGFTFWLSQHLRLYEMLIKGKLGQAARNLGDPAESCQPRALPHEPHRDGARDRAQRWPRDLHHRAEQSHSGSGARVPGRASRAIAGGAGAAPSVVRQGNPGRGGRVRRCAL